MAALIFALSSVAFAEPLKGYSEMFCQFYEKGSYLKFIQDEDNITITKKSSISQFAIDEDDIKIVIMGGSFYNFGVVEKSVASITEFNPEKYNFSLDENSNLIISYIPKSKKKK